MKLKQLREKTKLNQTQTAEKLGIPRVNYNKYENEEVEPNIDLLKSFADYFDVSLDYLCEHKTTNTLDTSSFTDEKKECIKIINELNDKSTTKLLGYLTLLQEQQKKD